jgi:hypothetical protein
MRTLFSVIITTIVLFVSIFCIDSANANEMHFSDSESSQITCSHTSSGNDACSGYHSIEMGSIQQKSTESFYNKNRVEFHLHEAVEVLEKKSPSERYTYPIYRKEAQLTGVIIKIE